MLRNIFLYGEIAETFGEKWTLDVSSPQEAARAINANTKGKFLSDVRDKKLRVIRGDSLENGEIIDGGMIEMNFGKGDFHFCPSVEGSGPQLAVGLVVGALLIGAVMYLSMPTVSPEDAMENDTKGYQFGGVNTVASQGTPLPLAYGEVFIGPTVISQGIKTEELPE